MGSGQRIAEQDLREIPTEEDWHSDPWDDLELPYAYKHFAGKSVEAAATLFAGDALSRQEDLCWMPAVCLRYYIKAYIAYLRSSESQWDADAASAFFSLIKLRGDDIRSFDEEGLDMIADTLRHLSTMQSWFDADQEIYGDFEEHAENALKSISR